MKTKNVTQTSRRSLFPVLIFCSACLLTTQGMAQNPTFCWADRMGGTSNETGTSVSPEITGGVFTVGTFNGTADFDPSSTTVNLTSAGSSDIFISKVNKNNQFLGAWRMGGSGADMGLASVSDVSGNIISTGYYSGTADFDPGTGTSNATSAGSTDIFVSKLGSTGTFGWIAHFGGTAADAGTAVTVDLAGDVLVAGYFNGYVTFGTCSLCTLDAQAGTDMFVMKLNGEDGSLIWVKQLGANSSSAIMQATGITTDRNLDVYVTGWFEGTVGFPGDSTTNITSTGTGNSDAFFISVNKNGGKRWTEGMGVANKNDKGLGLSIDLDGTIYGTGLYNGVEAYVCEFDPFYGTLTWAKYFTGSSSQVGNSIHVDPSGFIYTTGTFNGTTDFNPDGLNTANLTTAGSNDVYISKLDHDGNYVWTGKFGGNGNDVGMSVGMNAGHYLFLTGYFSGTANVDFDPGSGTYNMLTNGNNDIFTSKFQTVIPILLNSQCQLTYTPEQPVALTDEEMAYVPELNDIQKPGYQLIFNDEFNSSSMDGTKWEQLSYTIPHELVHFKHPSEGGATTYSYNQSHTDLQGTCYSLKITANHESMDGKEYTSGSFQSYRQFKHGYYEMRCKVPTANTTWTAFWLYGKDMDEIDVQEIVEFDGAPNDRVWTTYHFKDHGFNPALVTYCDENYPNWCATKVETFAGVDLASTFHTYAVEWAPGRLDFYLDNILVHSVKNDCNVPENMMKVIGSLGVAGFTGSPPNSTDFPQHFLIDYIRIYKKIWVENYGVYAGGYGTEHPRMMADVNGDGLSDIVAFGGAGVYVSLADVASDGATSFNDPALWIDNYGYDAGAGGWRVADHVRTMADVNGDGYADVVGFGGAGVYVSLSDGASSFSSPDLWIGNFGSDAGAGGWTIADHPRMVADVSGDGKADVVGFGASGVWVGLSDGDEFILSSSAWTSNYCIGSSTSWEVGRHPRMLVDMNVDGKADIVGFGISGTYVSLSNGSTAFGTSTLWSVSFGENSTDGAWSETEHVRTVAKVNGDVYPDLVGFYDDGVYVATGVGGSGCAVVSNWRPDEFGYNTAAGSWRVEDHLRMMADMDGDGFDDVVGFGSDGVYLAFSNGHNFSPKEHWNDFYGSDPDETGHSFTIADNPRMTADVNGDCRKDIVAFGDSGVFVTLSPQCNRYAYRTSNEGENHPFSAHHLNAVRHATGATAVSVYPNPVRDQATLKITGEFNTAVPATLVIMDITGRIVRQTEGISTRETIIYTGDLEPGAYLYQVLQNGSKMGDGKFVVMKE